MGEIIISTAKMEDAEELNRIECAAFPSAEAASLESYKYRITNIKDWFLKEEEDGKIVGACGGRQGDMHTERSHGAEPSAARHSGKAYRSADSQGEGARHGRGFACLQG